MDHADRQPGADRLERLRSLRARPAREVGLDELMGRARRELKRQHRTTGGLESAFELGVPEALRQRAWIERVIRGVVTIRAEDHATRHEIDRLLRTGLGDALIEASPTTVRKVRVVV